MDCNRHYRSALLSTVALVAGCSSATYADDVGGRARYLKATEVVAAEVETTPLAQYDGAPRTPDADDPAIWVNPERDGEGLVVAALKDAGLAVYNLRGELEQTILPPHRPPVSSDDPHTPGIQPESGTTACPDSVGGEAYSRFNNVDVYYGLSLRGEKEPVDIAVATDRGCDRLRIYRIDPERNGGPLVDITASGKAAGRVFPRRYVQPWTLASRGRARVEKNPVDDQSTAYGLALYAPKHELPRAFVTQRSRAAVAELELFDAGAGHVGYRRVREYRFPSVFSLRNKAGRRFAWSPCREDAADDPQLEGLVVDQTKGILYAAQEVVGIWQLDVKRAPDGDVVYVGQRELFEPVRSFGAPYWAVPSEGEFACEYEAPTEGGGGLPSGTLAQAGDTALGGQHIEADAEGLAIYYLNAHDGYLIASSQGDDTFHVFDRDSDHAYVGRFKIEGSGETDGHDVVNVPAGADFRGGLFVAQNGKAVAPSSSEPVNGYEYDGSTQFLMLSWEAIADSLELELDTTSYNPRR